MAVTAIPEVFILWHPRCVHGLRLAEGLLEWLRPERGFGPEVYFRSLPDPDRLSGALPMKLPGEAGASNQPGSRPKSKVQKQQVVFPLIDENMVADAAWRRWLERLAATSPPGGRVIFPVALDATAYNLPPSIQALNYLRPAGSPLPPGASDEAKARVQRSLNKQATEALCRLVLPRPPQAETGSGRSNEPPPKINVFLSHAKKDGTTPARRLRDYIYSQTQLTAFFDENDIAYGGAFAKILENAIASGQTAALIAVRSVEYASRPWCRREISLFRTPKKLDAQPDNIERWSLFPSLVVEAMTTCDPTVGVPEFGATRAIRWSDSETELDEKIVTTVIRDAMLAAYHRAFGAAIPAEIGQVVINWLPDPTTLLHIVKDHPGEELKILHPGCSLPGLELDILYDLFPQLEFISFEDALLVDRRNEV